jgi:hypothetical protein
MACEAAINRLCIIMLFVAPHQRVMPGENLTPKSSGTVDISRKRICAISEFFSPKSLCLHLLLTDLRLLAA